MLSTIGRAAVRRVVTRGPQSTNRALQSIVQFQRVDSHQSANDVSSQPQFSFSLRRSYATATTTKVTTKPKVKKSTTAKPKTKKAAPKKPVKKLVKKKVTKKPVVKKAKKVVTEKQKARAADSKRISESKALKATALKIPTKKPQTAWMVLQSEYVVANAGRNIRDLAKEAAVKYKALSPAELESYNHFAAQNKAENEIAYKKWVETYTPDEIRQANNARRALSKKGTKVWSSIQDTRLPKGPVRALSLFFKDRHASGDFKGISISDASKLLSKEWKELPASKRQVYLDGQEADKERYIKEHRAVFNRDPKFLLQEEASA